MNWMNKDTSLSKLAHETRKDELTASPVEQVVVPEICKAPLPPELWNIGDIVSRDGTDEHEITAFNWARDLIDVKCVKEPEPYDEESEPWIRLGETESNLTRRYSFVRAGK